jgi:hypothetical protein
MQISANTADRILARFPGPVTLYRSRNKWLLVLLGCVAFTASGTWMITDNQPDGWYVVLFFGAGVILSALMLLPGAGQLTLDANGFEAVSLFRRHRARWQDVNGFEVVSIPTARQKLVGYNAVTQKRNVLGELSQAIAGRNAALPDTYGFAVGDLARLMTQWQERACGADASPPAHGRMRAPPVSQIGS